MKILKFYFPILYNLIRKEGKQLALLHYPERMITWQNSTIGFINLKFIGIVKYKAILLEGPWPTDQDLIDLCECKPNTKGKVEISDNPDVKYIEIY